MTRRLMRMKTVQKSRTVKSFLPMDPELICSMALKTVRICLQSEICLIKAVLTEWPVAVNIKAAFVKAVRVGNLLVSRAGAVSGGFGRGAAGRKHCVRGGRVERRAADGS